MSNSIHVEDTLSLRCKHCGAPLEIDKNSSEFIQCGSCGMTQKLVDAREFLEQIMGQVYRWVKTSIPGGFDISGVDNVDAIARHNIFTTNIKPSLESDYSHFKFNSQRLLAQSLLLLPFITNGEVWSPNKPPELFEFNAKIYSIKPLVIDPEDKRYICEMDNLSESYAYLLNNLRLMQENKPERYELMAANFYTASESIKNNIDLAPYHSRLSGLSQVNLAIHLLINGNTHLAGKTIEQSIQSLKQTQESILINPSLAMMVQAVDREIIVAGIIEKMIQAAEQDPSGQPLNTVLIIEKIMQEIAHQERYDIGYWKGSFKDYSRYDEIFTWMLRIRTSQNGEVSIRVLKGSGSYLFPFWVVDLPYSFKTGVLWAKKGKETNETLFVSSTFPLYQDSLVSSPSYVLTNVFWKDQSKWGYHDIILNISGNETSISSGANKLRMIADSASFQQVGSKKIIPPLSSQKQVEKLVKLYITRMLETDRTIEKKMGLCAPKVSDLIFIPGELNNSHFRLDLDLGPLHPETVGDVRILRNIAM